MRRFSIEDHIAEGRPLGLLQAQQVIEEYDRVIEAAEKIEVVHPDIRPPSMRVVGPELRHLANIPTADRQIIGRWADQANIEQRPAQQQPPEDGMPIEEPGIFAPGGNGIDEDE